MALCSLLLLFLLILLPLLVVLLGVLLLLILLPLLTDPSHQIISLYFLQCVAPGIATFTLPGGDVSAAADVWLILLTRPCS